MKLINYVYRIFDYRLNFSKILICSIFLFFAPFVEAQESLARASSRTYWVTVNGSNKNDGTTKAKAWRTLKHACSKVASDQGHTIKMGEGTFYDSGRKNTNNIPAKLPRNVNLIGSGRLKTTYKGEIYVPLVKNQVIADFRLDGNENRIARKTQFKGLIIEKGTRLTVKNMKIDGFHSLGLQFGKFDGLSYSSLNNNLLINNGKHNERGFGMRTGNLINCKIFNNKFLEERGKGGEIWNTGLRKFTNVKIYNNSFTTHKDTNAGWENQFIFNFELFRVECLNVEIFNNNFDGSLSIVGPAQPVNPKSPYSVRIHNNRWEYTKRYAIELSMDDMVIDHNYFHFGKSSDPDKGGGSTAIASFGTDKGDRALIHHNVFENVPRACFQGLGGNQVKIYNNTIKGGSIDETPNWLKNDSPSFMTKPKSDWSIINNIFYAHSSRPGKFIRPVTGGSTPKNLLLKSNYTKNVDLNISATLLAQNKVDKPKNINEVDFRSSGSKPKPYFILKSSSVLIDAGRKISGITDGFYGTAPDIGAYESNYSNSSLDLSGWFLLKNKAHNSYLDTGNYGTLSGKTNYSNKADRKWRFVSFKGYYNIDNQMFGRGILDTKSNKAVTWKTDEPISTNADKLWKIEIVDAAKKEIRIKNLVNNRYYLRCTSNGSIQWNTGATGEDTVWVLDKINKSETQMDKEQLNNLSNLEIKDGENFVISPNPVQKDFSIDVRLSDIKKGIIAKIYNISGVKKQEFNLVPGSNILSTTKLSIPKGIYVIVFYLENNRLSSQKLIVN